jgi:uncharacterized protein (TIGR03083 family)
MADPQATDPAQAREAFKQAAAFLAETVARIPDDKWSVPALGVWDLRQLVGHADRATTSLERFVGDTADVPEIESPADYYVKALAAPGINDQVAEGGRRAAAALGDDPPAKLRESVERVTGVLDSLADPLVIRSQAGAIRLEDYLATRVVELLVHTLDIAAAAGLSMEPPPLAMDMVLNVLSELAVVKGTAPEVALALTGRRPLPDGFSVLG